MKNKNFSIKERILSFKYAFHGIFLFFRQEHNARIHLLACIMVTGLGIYFKLNRYEWIAILFAFALVFITEILNTSLEYLSNIITTEIHPEIKKVKDLAAAAVLISSIIAIIIGMLVFIF